MALRATAGVMSVTSAIAAYPVAANLFGAVPGGLMMSATAAAIYTGWHVVATDENTDKRIIAGVIACLFAVGMVAGIHASADMQTATASTTAASAADKLYADQEAARMAQLASVTAELRSTQKSKFPTEYSTLLAQVDKLSVPTPRQATASQITQGLSTASTAYRWGVASVFEIITPALLLLAGMFTRRSQREQDSVNTVDTVLTPVNGAFTQEKQQDSSSSEQVVHSVNSTDSDPLTALTNRRVTPTTDGYITVDQVVHSVNCSVRQARNAIADAVAQRVLTKTGTGNATRYRYAKPTLRAVK